MSALHNSTALATNSVIREMVAKVFWDWYDIHGNDVVLRKNILWFDLSIRVKDLKGLFERLVGPRGEA